jgi:hypothetical protein
MTSKIRAAAAVATIAALSLAAVPPAAANESPPALGFEIDPTEGSPGDEVLGQVDVDDVAEHCATTAEELQAAFQPFGEALAPLQATYAPAEGAEHMEPEYLAWQQLNLLALVISGNVLGSAETALPQTFVMTFADVDTQEPVGERGNFDPDTGAGAVLVPDVAPGPWAVAATCVAPSTDTAVIQSAIGEGAAFLAEALDLPDPLPVDFAIADPIGFLTEAGPTLLAPLMQPVATGSQLFCVLDATGACPSDEPPAEPGEPPAEPGEPPATPAEPTPAPAPPATPVRAAPTFTG